MEQIRKFLQGKGFALVLAACLLAAAAAGVWAVQTVRGELQKNLDGLRDPASSARTAPGIDEGLDLTTPDEEDSTEWQQPTAPAANSVANVPKASSSTETEEIMNLISAEDLDLTEYSDALVYRIIERITVLSKEEIRIRFIGGFEITHPLH